MTIKTRNIGDSQVTTAKIAANTITVGMLPSATLRTGYIPLDISKMRFITGDVVINTIEGGIPDGNLGVALARINGATDKAVRASWAATNVNEVMFPPFVLPPDIDSTAALTVKLRANMAAGGMDTPVISVSYFEGVGDTNAGGDTAALSTTVATVSVAVAAGDVGSAGAAVTIGLTPGAHNNEALHLYAAWVEYTRT